MGLTEGFCGTGAETKAGKAESWSDGATRKDRCTSPLSSWAGDLSVECLPSMHQALSMIASTIPA